MNAKNFRLKFSKPIIRRTGKSNFCVIKNYLLRISIYIIPYGQEVVVDIFTIIYFPEFAKILCNVKIEIPLFWPNDGCNATYMSVGRRKVVPVSEVITQTPFITVIIQVGELPAIRFSTEDHA